MSQSQYYYNPQSHQNNSQPPKNGYTQEDVYAVRREFYAFTQKAKAQKSELRKIGCILGSAIILYLVIQTVAASYVLNFNSDFKSLYNESPVFQYAFNVIFVSVLSVAVPFGAAALICKKKYRRPIIPNTPIKASRAFLWVSFGMGSCIVANVVVNYLIEFLKSVFNITLTQGETLSPDSVFACVMEVIAIAVIPAICEEFAMRCCSLQLLRNYGTGFAVFAVSVVFGLLHGNVIQFVFAFLIGVVLAYITVKTDSIVPAILIHLFNNGMSAVQDIAEYAVGGDIAENLLVVMFLFWIALGIISAIVLLIKKEFKKAKKNDDCVLSTGQKIGAFMFPGMILPFAVLILITATTVSVG